MDVAVFSLDDERSEAFSQCGAEGKVAKEAPATPATATSSASSAPKPYVGVVAGPKRKVRSEARYRGRSYCSCHKRAYDSIWKQSVNNKRGSKVAEA